LRRFFVQRHCEVAVGAVHDGVEFPRRIGSRQAGWRVRFGLVLNRESSGFLGTLHAQQLQEAEHATGRRSGGWRIIGQIEHEGPRRGIRVGQRRLLLGQGCAKGDTRPASDAQSRSSPHPANLPVQHSQSSAQRIDFISSPGDWIPRRLYGKNDSEFDVPS